jgi:hypothetical protein
MPYYKYYSDEDIGDLAMECYFTMRHIRELVGGNGPEYNFHYNEFFDWVSSINTGHYRYARNSQERFVQLQKISKILSNLYQVYSNGMHYRWYKRLNESNTQFITIPNI